MGKKDPFGDCEIRELTIGQLHFRAIDYGGAIRLYEKSMIKIGSIEAQEKNQCVLSHTVDGAQWIREGEKNGVPTLVRVLVRPRSGGRKSI